MRESTPRERLIFALDVEDEARARELVQKLRPYVGTFKFGLELLLRGGIDLVERVADGAEVFIDAKLHDVPATVSRAVARVLDGRVSVRFITVHDPTRCAVEAARGRATVLRVTTLTSIDPAALGGAEAVTRLVVARALEAQRDGAGGVVCSPREARAVREALETLGRETVVVTPGVRPAWASVDNDDQRRTATVTEALREGADHVVIGRPIRDARDPVEAAKRVLDEIDAVA